MRTNSILRGTCLFITICCLLFVGRSELQASYCAQVSLSSQADIDNFPSNFGCDSIGSLSISKTGLVVLDSLYPITYIETLSVANFSGYPRIETFRGLRNVTRIGSMTIRALLINKFLDFPTAEIDNISMINANFTGFSGLDSLRSLKTLHLFECPNFVNFNGLENLEYLEQIIIDRCNKIPKIKLPGLNHLDNVSINCCPKLIRIQDLGNVTTIQKLSVQALACGGSTHGGSPEGTFTIDHDLHAILGDGFEMWGTDFNTIEMPNTDSITSINFFQCKDLTHVQLKGLVDGVIREIVISGTPNLDEFNFINPPIILELDNLVIEHDFDISFLNQADFIGSMELKNTSITSWPFAKLEWLNNLTLKDNSQLTECCVLYDLIKQNRVSSYTISNNALGCSQFFDLYKNCGKPVDTDEDGILNTIDNCPNDFNQNQADSDGDGAGDVCDNCPQTSNADQLDNNGNKIGDACENPDYDTKLFIENGDALIDSPSGLILRGVDDNCYRIVVDGDGGLRTKIVPCP